MDNVTFSFEMPTSFRNEETVSEGERTFRYAAEAWGLHFDGMNNIRGGVSLAKYEVITTIARVRRLRLRKHWFPLFFETKVETRTKSRCVWTARTRYNHEYFVFEGMSRGDSPDRAYRDTIKSVVLNNHEIIVTDKLVELLFRPIDHQCLNLYRTAKGLSRGEFLSDSTFKVRRA